MARTSRVMLDRQEDASNRQHNPGTTQAGVPEVKLRASSADDKPTLDEIAEEAYAIYLGNGSQHGFDIDHWLEAERRISARKRVERAQRDISSDTPDDRK